MLVWSIEAALQSQCFDQVIVSTDDPEIAVIAKEYGATVPFLRPAELSDDHCGTVPVVQHAIDWFEKNAERPTSICCLYATAPFVQVLDLQLGYQTLINQECDFAFSVTSFAFPIQRALWKTDSNRVKMIRPEHLLTRSQDLQEAYHDAGQFYWGTLNAWVNGKSIFDQGSAPIVLPRYRVQDIDTKEDWIRAEMMFQVLQQSEVVD